MAGRVQGKVAVITGAAQGIGYGCAAMLAKEERGVSVERLQRLGSELSIGRHQTPEDTAYAVLYLASDESVQVTATILNVDAGFSTLPITPPAADATPGG